MVGRALSCGFAVLAASFTAVVQAAVLGPREDARPIRWEGYIFRDGKLHELYVTDIKDLWSKVLEQNHSFTAGITLDELGEPSGSRTCGSNTALAVGRRGQAIPIMTMLDQLGGYWTLDAKRCYRLGCNQNTGLYWCNQNDRNIRTTAQSLLLRARNIHSNCCPGGDTGGLNGMEWYPNDHREAAHSYVSIAYANCDGTHTNALPWAVQDPGTAVCPT
ncbi:hypothetical protein VTI74DRAFT_9195 [Chaetomium olivicolor]